MQTCIWINVYKFAELQSSPNREFEILSRQSQFISWEMGTNISERFLRVKIHLLSSIQSASAVGRSIYGLKKDCCPAFGKRCRKCQRINHFAVQCLSEGKQQQINSVSEEESDSEEYEDVMSFTLTPDKEHVNSLSESQYIFEASVRNREDRLYINNYSSSLTVVPHVILSLLVYTRRASKLSVEDHRLTKCCRYFTKQPWDN